MATLAQTDMKPWAKPALRAFYLLLVIVAGWFVIRGDADRIGELIWRVDPAFLGCALLAALSNIVLTAISWRALFEAHPKRPNWLTAARIFFPGQLGKYVPGTVWSFLASAELAKAAGLSRTTSLASLLLATLIGLITGMVFGSIAAITSFGAGDLDWRLIGLGALALAILALLMARKNLLRRVNIDFPLPPRAFGLSVCYAMLAWGAAGLQLFCLSNALGGSPDVAFIAQATGIYALAWCAGFAAFFAPAGFGAREATMAAFLAVTMPVADALAVALLSRVLMTVADFLLGGAFLNPRPVHQVRPAD